MARLRPFEPIFDVTKRRGSMRPGNSPAIPFPDPVPTLGYVGSVFAALPLGGAHRAGVVGSTVFVTALDDDRFTSVDVSNPASPAVITSLGTTNWDTPRGVVIDGNYAYVAVQGSDRVNIVDISNPAAMSVVGVYSTSIDNTSYVAKAGNRLYVTNSGTGPSIKILDVSNPASPSLLGSVGLTGARGVVIDGNYAYVGRQAGNGVSVVDVSNPASPTVVGSVIDGTNLAATFDLCKVGNYVYAWSVTPGRLNVIDVSMPSSPTLVGAAFNRGGASNGHAIQIGPTTLALAVSLDDEVHVIDITNPLSPVVAGTYTHANLDLVEGLATDGSYVYCLCGNANRLTIMDII